MMNCKLLLVIGLLITNSIGYSQNEKDSLIGVWKNTKIEDSARANSYFYLISNYYQNQSHDSSKTMAESLHKFILERDLHTQKSSVELMLGNIEFEKSNFQLALYHYNNALKTSQTYSDLRNEAKALSNIGQVHSFHFKFDKALDYLGKSKVISETLKDTTALAAVLMNIGNAYGNKYKFDESTAFYEKSLELYEYLNDERNQAKIYNLLGDNYDLKENYLKSGEYYFHSLEIFRKYNDLNNERQVLFSLSASYLKQKKYHLSIDYGLKREEIDEKLGMNIYSTTNYYNLSDASKAIGDMENAFKYLEKATNVENQINQFNANKKLQELEIAQIQTKDSLINIANNLKTEMAHQKEKTNLTMAWGGSLSALSLFAFIIFRNTKRKQRKAERERQQQIEEKEKILKDLELSTINAMIEGQEKERQRLAEDLHDSVGATLTDAKMQFEYLIKHQNDAKASEELIKKTSTLLENAYVEIRSMAHLKNSGVMAKNGLLPAVEKLSANASGLNGLHFNVNSHGLDQRLENAVEIAVFRIIQELTTNVIKHANATQATIHLTNHDDSLNIMVEDNGKGFNPSQITKTKAGMGISSIDNRVEHLGGTMTIESEANKGTTVIIDIPV